jgi:hypothetical protein
MTVFVCRLSMLTVPQSTAKTMIRVGTIPFDTVRVAAALAAARIRT